MLARTAPALLVLLLALPAWAGGFDGRRTGLVMGAGVGPGLHSFEQTVETLHGDREAVVALATDLRLGLGINDRVVVFLHSRSSWFGIDNVLGDHVTIRSAVDGLGLGIHPEGASGIYFVGGFGIASWGPAPGEPGSVWTGAGVDLGVGWEFTPHWSLELSLLMGNPSRREDFATAMTDFYAGHLTLVGVAY